MCARDLAAAGALCEAIAHALPPASRRISVAEFPAALAHLAGDADLVVNATSLGLHPDEPLPWDSDVRFRPSQVVYDLIYNRHTEFLSLARQQGAQAIDGLGMLVHQGARSFEIWTGLPAPVEVMRRAVKDG